MNQPSAFLFVIEVALCRCVGLESLSASNLSIFPSCAESLRRNRGVETVVPPAQCAIAQSDFARQPSARAIYEYCARAQMDSYYWSQDALLKSASASADFFDRHLPIDHPSIH